MPPKLRTRTYQEDSMPEVWDLEAKARAGKNLSTRRAQHTAGTDRVSVPYPLVDHHLLSPTRGIPIDFRETHINNAIVNRLYSLASALCATVNAQLLLQLFFCYRF